MPGTERNTRSEPDWLTRGQLRHALDRLVTSGVLTTDQAGAVRREVAAVRASGGAAPIRPTWITVLAEIGGYVGGAFVLGAAAVLVADNWDSLPTATRPAVLDIPGALLLLAAWYVRRSTPEAGTGRDAERGARRRMVSVFVTVAAALLGTGTGVILDELSTADEWAAASGFATALAVVGAGYTLFRGPLLHIATGVALLGTIESIVAATVLQEDVASGWAMVVVAVGWAAATLTHLLREREFGFGWAGLLAFTGGEMLVSTGMASGGYAVLVALAIAGMAGFVVLRAFTLLVTGVGTLAVVIPQIVIDVTDGTLGAAGALLVVGLSIVGASVLGLRLRRTATPSTTN